MEEHVLRVAFVEACEHPAGAPPFVAKQFPHGVFDSFVETNIRDVDACWRAARMRARPTPCRRERGATSSRSMGVAAGRSGLAGRQESPRSGRAPRRPGWLARGPVPGLPGPACRLGSRWPLWRRCLPPVPRAALPCVQYRSPAASGDIRCGRVAGLLVITRAGGELAGCVHGSWAAWCW